MTLRPRPRRQSPPIASLFATAPIDAGPNSKCISFSVIFLYVLIFFLILVARSAQLRIRHFPGAIVRDPSCRTKWPHINRTPLPITSCWSEPVMEGRRWGSKLGPKFLWRDPIGTQFRSRGTQTWTQTLPQLGTQFWDPIVFCVQLRTKSLVRECGVGWCGRFGGVTADVNCDEFQVIWVVNWVPPKKLGPHLGPSKKIGFLCGWL